MNNLKFTIHEAYTRDIGRGVIRIDQNTMDDLMITSGDTVEICGKNKAVAKGLPLYPADEGKKIVRIDGLGRNNLGVEIGDAVSVRKIKSAFAGSVMVLPLQGIPPVDPRYIADALESVPIIPGQFVMIPYFGGRLTFKVVGIIPEISDDVQTVIVTQKTIFGILDQELAIDSSDQSIEDTRYSILQKVWTVEKLSKPEFDDLIKNLTKFYDIVHKKIIGEK